MRVIIFLSFLLTIITKCGTGIKRILWFRKPQTRQTITQQDLNILKIRHNILSNLFTPMYVNKHLSTRGLE